jgi:hypothetical protein
VHYIHSRNTLITILSKLGIEKVSIEVYSYIIKESYYTVLRTKQLDCSENDLNYVLMRPSWTGEQLLV